MFACLPSLVAVVAVFALGPAAAAAQDPEPAAQAETPAGAERIEGTVVSVRRASLTVRTDAGRYRVFELDRTTRPARPLQPGMRVAVMVREDDEADAPLAIAVAILQADEAPAARAGRRSPDPVPAEVRAMEGAIERELRRYNAGVVAGVSVQPELIVVGGHATFERVFRRAVSVRPGLQLGFGEITTLLAIDVDVLYTFPGATRRTRWAPYAGGGPSIAFRHRGFEGEEDDGSRFDFDDFDAENGFNFIVGMRNRTGAFFEMKATAGGVSDVRLLAGVTF